MTGAAPRRRSGAASRTAEVAPERLSGWVERFSASHGATALSASARALVLTAADGTRAVLTVPWPPLPAGWTDPMTALAEHAARPRTAALVLVRRGGWAAGLARDGVLLDHSGGTRLVQGRTAAGGWSQQRYARRRAHQADALVGAAVGAVARVLERSGGRADVVVGGGDAALLDDVLSHPALRALAPLPRSALLAVPDPRHAVLVEAARRARAVRVLVTDGGGR